MIKLEKMKVTIPKITFWQCTECGANFSVIRLEDDMRKEREQKKPYYCPNCGHRNFGL